MANSKCCKYTSGNEVREYTPNRWTLSTEFPSDNNFNNHKVTSPSKFGGKTIRKITDDLIKSNDKENLCSLHYTIDYVLKNITQYKNNQTARDIKTEIDDHCEKCPKKDYKCKCKKKLGEDYDTKSGGCEEGYSWNDKKCACKKDAKEEKSDDIGAVSPVEEIRGCMVNNEGLPDDVTVNYDPEATLNFGCTFKKSVELENKFCFCITDTCEEIGNCISGTQVITNKSSSYESFEKKYNNVFGSALEAVAGVVNPFNFRLSTEIGFYGEQVDNSYVLDLAKALTILVFREYSLSSRAKGNIKNSDLVMQNEGGEYLGFFSGASNSNGFEKFNLQLTSPIVRVRVANNIGGTIVDKSIVSSIQRIIKNLGGESDKVKNVSIDSEGLISLQENMTKIGLGTLLETKVVGLAKLLK